MNAVFEQEQDIVANLNALGPGDRLRNARLALDMDVAELARRLHLTVDVIEALERDDYSEMTARVFVRGYLRNYAREVNLPVSEVLEQFDRVWLESEPPMRRVEPPRLASDTLPNNRWTEVATWVIVLSLVALLLIWWQGYLDDFVQQSYWNPDNPASETATTSEQSNNLANTTQPAQTPFSNGGVQNNQLGAQNTIPNQASTFGSPATLANQPPEANTTTGGGNNFNAATNAPNLLTTPATQTTSGINGLWEAPGLNSDLTDPLLEPPLAGELAGNLGQPLAAEADNASVIMLSFSGASWINIEDSSGDFSLRGAMNAGESYQLEGVPPYRMVIGNATASQISIDGEPYDLRQHTNGNVARFTLNP